MGYSVGSLKKLASYCFTHERKSFEAMDDFIKKLCEKGIIDDKSVNSYLDMITAEDDFLKNVLSRCSLTRRIIPSDRETLARWRGWGFSDEMILKAAELSAGKNNPVAYMNGVLSSWKAEGTFTPDKIEGETHSSPRAEKTIDRSGIERPYAGITPLAEDKAETTLERALADSVYGALHKEINQLNIKLAFAESRADGTEKQISQKIAQAERSADERLKALGINREDFTPHYSCRICGDTGYDVNGNPCKCLKKFIEEYKNS